MKTLFLVRHADAENQTTNDRERALSCAGMTQASNVGQAVAQLGDIDYLASSVAVRTQQTARQIIIALEKEPAYACCDPIRSGSDDDIIAMIREFPDWAHTAMVVGHNPTISMVAARLCENTAIGGFSPSRCLRLIYEIENWTQLVERTGLMTHDIDGNA
ncbi:MAG: histidine phosphatase family protein [Pseudomonadota bacterium]